MNRASLGDNIMFESRLRQYDDLWKHLDALPLNGRRVFDAGCANGKWLDICCKQWGAAETNCFGNDKRNNVWSDWVQKHSDTKITFINQSAHELTLPSQSFDIVHQSMMLSSIIDPAIRSQTAATLWEMLAPGGLLISYDFWTNPLNPRTHGITVSELRRLFPGALQLDVRSLTLAPPLCRVLSHVSDYLVLRLEKLKVMNTHLLVALQRPRK